MFELENALDEYLSHLRIERGASPRTAEAYRRDLEDYLAFLDGEGVEGFGDIDREKVAAFERSLMEQNLAVTTVRRRISAVRGYHRFLVREGLAHANPADAVDIPKAADRLPDVLSIEEVGEMLDAFVGTRPSDLRDRALLEVLYGCGCAPARPWGSIWRPSTSTTASCACSARDPRSASCPLPARPSARCAGIWPKGRRPSRARPPTRPPMLWLRCS